MQSSGTFSPEALDEITQEVIDSGVMNAIELSEVQWPLNVKSMCSIYYGNRFRIIGDIWL